MGTISQTSCRFRTLPQALYYRNSKPLRRRCNLSIVKSEVRKLVEVYILSAKSRVPDLQQVAVTSSGFTVTSDLAHNINIATSQDILGHVHFRCSQKHSHRWLERYQHAKETLRIADLLRRDSSLEDFTLELSEGAPDPKSRICRRSSM